MIIGTYLEWTEKKMSLIIFSCFFFIIFTFAMLGQAEGCLNRFQFWRLKIKKNKIRKNQTQKIRFFHWFWCFAIVQIQRLHAELLEYEFAAAEPPELRALHRQILVACRRARRVEQRQRQAAAAAAARRRRRIFVTALRLLCFVWARREQDIECVAKQLPERRLRRCFRLAQPMK